MMRVPGLIILFFLLQYFCNGQSTFHKVQGFINPTGKYKLNSKTKVKDGETYGYFGEINVKLIDSNKIAMSFYICKGAPSYNSGSFVDTFLYYNSIAVYKDKYDTVKACKVIFTFSKTKIRLQETAKYEYGTCWGAGVIAFGEYSKVSSKVPIIKDPLVDE